MAAQRKHDEFEDGFAPAPAPRDKTASVETASEAGVPVLHDVEPAPSPARALQDELEARVMRDGMINVSPRQVLATIIVICLAFWVAVYQLAMALF